MPPGPDSDAISTGTSPVEGVGNPPADLLPSPPPQPRVWTVFVTLLAAFCACLVSQIVGAIGLVVWYFARGGTTARLPSEVPALAAHPVAFIFLNSLAQLSFVAVAVTAAWRSPQGLQQRLGLLPPTLPVWGIAVVTAGIAVPFALGLSLAEGLAHFLKPDASVEEMYEQMTPAVALPFILYIALAPGFAEEILFRGYAQRRLLERWPAWIAILVTSSIFALFHVTPTAMVAVFPLGVWLGVLAWRTGSVWPGIVCHATVNGVWNVWNVGMALGYFPKETPLVLIVLGIAGSVAFIWALALLFDRQWKEPTPSPVR